MTDMLTEQEQKYGLIPDMEWLLIDSLVIDDKYQRDTVTRRSLKNIQTIRDNFSWAKCSPLTVADLGTGKYAVIDGQHRLEGARQLGDIPSLPCWILPQPNTAQQAEAFIGINKNRVDITAYAVYKAEVAAGNATAVMINEFCKKNNIIIPKNSVTSAAPNVTNALCAIRKYLTKGQEEQLTYAINIIRQAFPFKSGQLKAEIIKMIINLYNAYGNKITTQILIEALRSFEDVQNIINKGRELTQLDRTVKPDIARRKILINRYNELKRKRTGNGK